MNIYIPLALLAALICYFFRANEKKAIRAFVFTMIVACFVLAIRYEFGPDYFNYRDIYYGVHGSVVEGYTGAGASTEMTFLYFLSYFPSYTSFIVFLTVALFLVNTLFIAKYVAPKYFWIAILFMFLEPTFLLLEMVALRSAIGAILFVVAFFFLLKGKRLIYASLIVLASLIHTSCIVLLVFALFSKNRNSIIFNQWLPFICLAAALVTIVLGDNFIVSGIVEFALDNVEELNRYEDHEAVVGGVVQSLFSVLFRVMSFIIFLFLSLSARKETDGQYILIYKIAIAAVMIQLIFGQSLIGDRYLMILDIIYICAIIRSLDVKQIIDPRIVLMLIAMISIYMMYSKLSKPYNESFLVYRSIFDAPLIP